MKKTIINVVVVLLVFIASFTLFSHLMNSDNIDKTIELSECTLPTVSAYYGDKQINYLYGYTVNMQGKYMRDTLTPLDEENKLNIQVQTYGQKVDDIKYEVRSLDTKRLIEDSAVEQFTQENNLIDVRLNIQDLLADNTEYLLNIKLKTEKNDEINYYTRITKSGNYHVKEMIDFVVNFHNKTLEKSEDIVTNLESNSTGDNSNYNNVNIHSSFSQVTFGNLDIKQTGVMQIQLKEINSEIGIILLDYRAQLVNSAGETETYDLEEYYRVRYTKDRMYLLDYERTMEEVFNENNNIYYNKAISLGIANDKVEYKANSDGNIVSFVQQGNLYCYNKSNNTITKIYGFSGGDDIRYENQLHDIKIIDVDESGSTDFIVTGYVVRGEHEGKTGVGVYRYDSVINGVEEKLFITSDKSYEILKMQIGDLSYISAKGVLYISFNGDVYEISLESRQSSILVDSKENGVFKVSENDANMVWQESKNDFESKTLNVINFDSGSKDEITVSDEERIKPIGFIGDDLIYGIARYSDIAAGGFTVFPMYKVIIVNEKKEIVKEYEPQGMFVTDGIISENMLNMTRMTYNGSNYVLARGDQIVHSIVKEDEKVVLASIVTEAKKKEYQLQFASQLKEKSPARLYPKIVVYENKDEFSLDIINKKIQYYVYQKGKLDNTYTDAAAAFYNASANAGIVVNENQACIYDRIKKYDKYQIEGFPTVSVSEGSDSLTACVRAVLDYYDITADVETAVRDGAQPIDVLKTELGEENVVCPYGQPLDNILYMVSAGYPVIVKTDSNNYAVLVGYDALNTIVMNPLQGKTGYVGLQDSKAMFEAAGNIFVGCVK